MVHNLISTTGAGADEVRRQSEINRTQKRDKARADCEAKGGRFDVATGACILPQQFEQQEAAVPERTPLAIPQRTRDPNAPAEVSRDSSGRLSGITIQGNRDFVGLSPSDVRLVAEQQAGRLATPEGSIEQSDANAQRLAQQQQLEQLQSGQALQGQVGQFNELGIQPTGLDTEEALRIAAVEAIPSAISSAVRFGTIAAAAGAVATAPVGGIGAVPAAAIGAAGGFVAGLTSGIIGSFKGQRRDTTSAQQRVLDEGKQTMNDWVTMAESDPANKGTYLKEFNKVSAQIDAAYRQMKLDTNEDAAKFETALPNLAEFESFYSAAGERDVLNQDMRNALVQVSPPTYNMLELASRRGRL